MSAPRRPFAWPLAVANLMLLAAAAWPWLQHAAPPVRIAASRGAAEARLAPLPPLAEFAATVERPLFSPTRRPAPGAAAGVAGGGRFRLQGVMIAGSARRALIADSTGGKTVDVAEGDSFEGYKVARIERDRVILSAPSGETVLELGGR